MSRDTLRPNSSSNPTLSTDPGTIKSDGWWAGFSERGLGSFSKNAQTVVEADARFVVTHGATSPLEGDWPESRVRTGIVVGSVQSGKTASMLSVSALLLDSGLDLLVVLAGSRIALWRQTYERLLAELDGSDPDTDYKRRTKRVLIPNAFSLLRGDQRPTSKEYLNSESSAVDRALRFRTPIIMVVPKHERHLLDIAEFLSSRFGELGEPNPSRPYHMVILDDEADDGSVMDAAQGKTIPQRIEMLWTGKRWRHETRRKDLFATYIAYTATPQANFLQYSHNPLSPRDFCLALRTPYKTGPIEGSEREPTFQESNGVESYYCGGEMFYLELRNERSPFCRPSPFPDVKEAHDPEEHSLQVRAVTDEMISDGIRAYLVAAALRLRLARSGSEGDTLSMKQVYSDDGIVESELGKLPKTHTMLVHPSSSQAIHKREARRIWLWSKGLDPDHPGSALELPEGEVWLDRDGLVRALDRDEEQWLKWVKDYSLTVDSLATLPGATYARPTEGDWSEIRKTLVGEVFPFVRLRIINSEEDTDDRPLFHPIRRTDGLFDPPPDLFTIFVSGNVMSRGLTLDGLCTSVFVRPSNEPAADTQMQMQRWFGYRGSHLPYCRLICFEDQLELFTMYHEHDVAMRREILKSMRDGTYRNPRIVLQGPRSLATSKVPTSKLPLSPGGKPTVRLLEVGKFAEHNSDRLATLLDGEETKPLFVGKTKRAHMLTRTFSLLEVAGFLEDLRYEHHDPDPEQDEKYARWESLAAQLKLTRDEGRLFRPPGEAPGEPAVPPSACPFSIAAYLRLWDAALRRSRCDGLFPSDAPGTSWQLSVSGLHPPQFYVGVRLGAQGPTSWPRLNAHGLQSMKRTYSGDEVLIADTLWGTRGHGGTYYGDEYIDYHVSGFPAPELHSEGSNWRPRGDPGLLLFHIVQVSGRSGDAVTVGLGLPHGGPDHIAALS